MNLALRYDWFNGAVDEQTLPAGRWNPSARFDAIADVPNWKDVSPRLGLAYDLFGDGKTAVKTNLSRYVAAQTVAFAASVNPMTTIGTNDNRSVDGHERRLPASGERARPDQQRELRQGDSLHDR